MVRKKDGFDSSAFRQNIMGISFSYKKRAGVVWASGYSALCSREKTKSPRGCRKTSKGNSGASVLEPETKVGRRVAFPWGHPPSGRSQGDAKLFGECSSRHGITYSIWPSNAVNNPVGRNLRAL